MEVVRPNADGVDVGQEHRCPTGIDGHPATNELPEDEIRRGHGGHDDQGGHREDPTGPACVEVRQPHGAAAC